MSLPLPCRCDHSVDVHCLRPATTERERYVGACEVGGCPCTRYEFRQEPVPGIPFPAVAAGACHYLHWSVMAEGYAEMEKALRTIIGCEVETTPEALGFVAVARVERLREELAEARAIIESLTRSGTALVGRIVREVAFDANVCPACGGRGYCPSWSPMNCAYVPCERCNADRDRLLPEGMKIEL